MTAQQWGDPKGEAISQQQAMQLSHIARDRFREGWQAKFRYWLTCRGYYYIKNPNGVKPLYCGSTLVIPVTDFEAVQTALQELKQTNEDACRRSPAR